RLQCGLHSQLPMINQPPLCNTHRFVASIESSYMNNAEFHFERNRTFKPSPTSWVAPTLRPNFLCVVSDQEVAELRDALNRGDPPEDFASKLDQLSGEDLSRRFIEQNCRLFVALLQAAKERRFREV